MIQITNMKVDGLEAAIRGMRNSYNSWNNSDSVFDKRGFGIVGDADLALMKSLVKAGTDHSKFMRFITISMDVRAPLYWWKEFDQYKIGTTSNSCSTMHTIMKKPFTESDFSFENVYQNDDLVEKILIKLNNLRFDYIEAITDEKKQALWREVIQLLPSSYMQQRTLAMNYQVLRNVYQARKNHKLSEWRTFCDNLKYLPLSELIIL